MDQRNHKVEVEIAKAISQKRTKKGVKKQQQIEEKKEKKIRLCRWSYVTILVHIQGAIVGLPTLTQETCDQ